MKILKFSTPTCGQCRVVGEQMRRANITYQEIDCTTDEGSVLTDKYGVHHVPTVIKTLDDGTEIERFNNLPSITKAIAKGSFKTL